MEHRTITPVQVATVFTGSFLGAGFLSGQELLQFFARFGFWGLGGMVLSIAAFCLFGLMSMRIAKRTGQTAFDRIIVRRSRPVLRGFFSVFFLLFLFGVMVSMTAAAGALLCQLTGLPVIVGSAALAVLVLLVALTGAAGVLASFGVVVPLLVAVAAVISVLAFALLPAGEVVSAPGSGENPLLGNWLLSACSFSSYNMMCAISILVPMTAGMEDEHVIHRGLALGGALLSVIFCCILLPLLFFRGMAAAADLPMLALASMIHPALGGVYGVLLLCGMFTAALSSLFSITSRLQVRAGGALRVGRLSALLAGLAFLGSLLGFKKLVGTVFPVFGYVGLLSLAGILLHHRALRRAGQTPPNV